MDSYYAEAEDNCLVTLRLRIAASVRSCDLDGFADEVCRVLELDSVKIKCAVANGASDADTVF